MTWIVRVLCLIALAVVAWVLATAWPAVRHGYPLYAILLGLTVVGAVVIGWRSLTRRGPRHGWALVLGIVGIVLGTVWIVAMWWLRPFNAVEPALAAMRSDDAVTVSESPTEVVMTPTGTVGPVGVVFQPGAKVEARAYAAVLRPLAEAGHLVVIPKQPLNIAFLATGAFDSAREAHPQVTSWVVGGHSLGGTVASMTAAGHSTDPQGPATGLLLYASYPPSDYSTSMTSAVVSISGTNDGLATPADIAASKANLPADARFEAITGAVHSFFGDYGPQPGDGQPTITHDAARTQISTLSTSFVDSLG